MGPNLSVRLPSRFKKGPQKAASVKRHAILPEGSCCLFFNPKCGHTDSASCFSFSAPLCSPLSISGVR